MEVLEQILVRLDELDELRKELRAAERRKPRLLDLEAAAEYLSLSPAYLQQKAASELGLKSIKIGKYIRFDIKDLDAYVQRQPRRGAVGHFN